MEDATLKNMSELDDLASYLVPNTNSTPVIVRGRGAEVWDESGKKYVDLEAGPGVASVGHCHPRVVDAIKAQAEQLLQSPGRFHSRRSMQLAKRIAALTKDRLKRVFFANSGAEANDGAIKIALKHAFSTGKRGFGILAFEHAFHGRLSLALSLTGMASRKKGFGPYASFPGVVHVAAPYCYRCPFGLTRPSCGTKCATSIEDTLKTKVPGEAAIMIAEPILAVGGVIVPPDDYWPRVVDILRRNRIILIHDEVFAGFGRTGKTFAHEHWDTQPDVVSFAKAIGGGIPLGGFIATEALASTFEDGDHFTTFGANNQVGAAAGHAVLDVLEEERLADRAAVTGARFMDDLQRLARQYKFIGEVRGRGLMIGVEIVADGEGRKPAPDLAKRIQADMRERGVIIGVTGNYGCVLRITPPLVVSEEQTRQAAQALAEACARV